MKIRISSRYSPCSRTADGRFTRNLPIVDAIKAVCNISYLGLKDAKDFVEELDAGGSQYSKQLEVMSSLSAPDVQKRLYKMRAVGLDVIEVGTEALEEFRTHTRKMISVTLEQDNLVLAHDLFNLYEKHFTR